MPESLSESSSNLEACNLIKTETPAHVVSVTFAQFLSRPSFVENLRTAAFEKKQKMNYRFNTKNGVTENHLNYLPEKCNKKI